MPKAFPSINELQMLTYLVSPSFAVSNSLVYTHDNVHEFFQCLAFN